MARSPHLSSRLARLERFSFKRAAAFVVPGTGDQSDVVNVRDFGAVGDGVADDAPAIQSAIDALVAAGGGVLYFPPGVYSIQSYPAPHIYGAPWVALLMQFSTPNTRPVAILGHGATLKYDIAPYSVNGPGTDLNMLAIYGGAAGTSTPWALDRYHLRGLRVEGLTCVGNRTADDLTTDNNTLLRLEFVEAAKVNGCHFEGCSGSGLWYSGRGVVVDGNTFHNTNGGVQGITSQGVVISNNVLRCTYRCDDQIGAFGHAAYPTTDVVITGNTVNKGWNGVKYVGGTSRSFAKCVILGNDVRGASITGNVMADNNSFHEFDLYDDPGTNTQKSQSGAAIRLEGYGTECPSDVVISGNTIRNCRYGILANAAWSKGLRISENVFRQVADLSIVAAVVDDWQNQNEGLAITGNTFFDCGSAGANTLADNVIRVLNAVDAKINDNIMRQCYGGVQISVGGAYYPTTVEYFQARGLEVCRNTIETTNAVPYPNGYAIRLLWPQSARVNGNRIVAPYGFHLGVVARGDYLEYSDNWCEGYTGNRSSIECADVRPVGSPIGAVVSTGNWCIPAGEALTGKHARKTFPTYGTAAVLSSGWFTAYGDAAPANIGGMERLPHLEYGDTSPPPSAALRGMVIVTRGNGAGQMDDAFLCRMTTTGTFEWAKLTP